MGAFKFAHAIAFVSVFTAAHCFSDQTNFRRLQDDVQVDGGGVQSGTCVLPFEVDGVKYTECVSLDEVEPYRFDSEFESVNPETSGTTWCAVELELYVREPEETDKSRRKLWGFCVDGADGGDDESDPGNAEYFADGGWKEEPTPCVENWEFKSEGADGEVVLTAVSGICISFDEQVPYGYDLDDVTLVDPTDSQTDQTRWCSTRAVYNPFPAQENRANRKDWGYCLHKSNQTTETTDPPSAPSGTVAPTSDPAVVIFFADGAFQEEVVPCAVDWQFKEKTDDGNIFHTASATCIPFSEHEPFGFDSSDLLSPSRTGTDTNLWCSTVPIYNPTPERTEENREQWGFCYDSRVASAPTGMPTNATTATNVPTIATPTSEPPTVTPTSENRTESTNVSSTGSPSSSPITPPTMTLPPIGTLSPSGGNPPNNSVPSTTPTAAPTIDQVARQIDTFVKDFGLAAWNESSTAETVPSVLEDYGVTEVSWIASEQTLRMQVDQACSTEVETEIYQTLKQMYPEFEFTITCETLRRILQDGGNTTSQTSVVEAAICTEDCSGTSENIENNDAAYYASIIVPSVLVGLVAIGTAVYVVKKRRSMRQRKDGVVYEPPKEKKRRFGLGIGASLLARRPSMPKRPRVTLKPSFRSKSKSNSETVVTSSGMKDSVQEDIKVDPQQTGSSTTNSFAYTHSATSFQEPQNNPPGDENGQDPQFEVPKEEGNTEAEKVSNEQGANQMEANTSVEKEPNNTQGPTPTTQSVNSSSSSNLNSQSNSKKKAQKMTCEVCSSTFYSASGKTKCLKCRDDKRKKSCEQCGATFISVSGKSTKCMSCRKTAT